MRRFMNRYGLFPTYVTSIIAHLPIKWEVFLLIFFLSVRAESKDAAELLKMLCAWQEQVAKLSAEEISREDYDQ